jgi:3-dehydrosphinganine reductase
VLDWADQESISRPGQIIQAIPADLTQSSTSTEALEKASVAHGGRTPDHVYLCAGSSRPKFMLDSSEEEFKGVYLSIICFMG